jgi:hypothetical protein
MQIIREFPTLLQAICELINVICENRMAPLDIQSNLKAYALKIYQAIFNNLSEVELEGKLILIQKFKSSRLRYVDLSGYRFIEQNPNKDSHWAEMARTGKKIMWVFRGRVYYARVIDGNFILLKNQ